MVVINRKMVIFIIVKLSSESSGALAQSAECGADNAEVVSSTLTRTISSICFLIS